MSSLARPVADSQAGMSLIPAPRNIPISVSLPGRIWTIRFASRLYPRREPAPLPPDRQQKSREFGQPYDRFLAGIFLLE